MRAPGDTLVLACTDGQPEFINTWGSARRRRLRGSSRMRRQRACARICGHRLIFWRKLSKAVQFDECLDNPTRRDHPERGAEGAERGRRHLFQRKVASLQRFS